MKNLIFAVIAIVGLTVGGLAQSAVSPEAMLKSAIQREQVDGDEPGALGEYQAIVRQFPSHAVAVKALMRAAGIYERSGLPARARESYEQVVSHPRAGSLARDARARLAVLPAAGSKSQQSTQRAVLIGRDANQVWSRVSPDGRYLPFLHSTGNLAVRDLLAGTTIVVTTAKQGEGFVEAAVWSPDMKQLAYSWWDNSGPTSRMQLRIVDREKGTSLVLYAPADLDWLEPQAWSPDGRSILTDVNLQSGQKLALISVNDGTLRQIKTAFPASYALFSPDGRFIAYGHTRNGAPMGDISMVAIDGTSERALVQSPDHDYLLGWFPDGRHLLFASDRSHSLSAWAVALKDGTPDGVPVLVKPDIGRTAGLGFDKNGKFYSVVTVGGMDIFLAEIDPATGLIQQQSVRAPRGQPLARRGQAAWSADGRRLVYTQTIEGRGTSIVEQSLAGGEMTMRPVKLTNIERPFWFPDGKTVALEANEKGRQVFRVDLRDGAVSQIGPAGQNFWGLFPDGSSYVYSGFVDGKPTVLRRNLASGSETVLRAGRASAAISPDGTTLAFWFESAKNASISVKPSAGGEERVVISSLAGSVNRIAWSHDGRHVFYVSNNSEIWRVPIGGGEAVDTGVRVPLPKRITVSPDGTRIALTGGAASAEVLAWENLQPLTIQGRR